MLQDAGKPLHAPDGSPVNLAKMPQMWIAATEIGWASNQPPPGQFVFGGVFSKTAASRRVCRAHYVGMFYADNLIYSSLTDFQFHGMPADMHATFLEQMHCSSAEW
jgi:hypothetical protein